MKEQEKKKKRMKIPKFYNYEPTNKQLKRLCRGEPDIENITKQLDEEYKAAVKNAFSGNILDQLNAKDINTDLKRDFRRKLDVLLKKTDESFFELIKNKLNKNIQELKTDSASIGRKGAGLTEVNSHRNEYNENKLGYILHQAINKLDILDESD